MSGCGDPLSNRLFLEDAAFVAALPSDARLGPPLVLASAAVGDSDLQGMALEQVHLLDGALMPLARTGEALRAAQPSLRTDDYREWDAVPVVADNGGQWWARSNIRRPESDVTTWVIEIAATEEGPYILAAVGQQDAPDVGVIEYTVTDTDSQEYTLQMRYGHADSGERELEVVVPTGPLGLNQLYWKWTGDTSALWTGAFEVNGRQGVPGAAQVVQGLQGGRAQGLTDEPDEWFGSCWDGPGTEVWRGGSWGTDAGDETLCSLPRLF